MNLKTIELEIIDDVAIIWLNRPEKRNALNDELLYELNQIIIRLNKDPGISVVVLRGKNSVLSAGADIQWMQKTGNDGFFRNVWHSKKIADCFYRFFALKQITIVVVEKVAYGGILGFIAAADMVIAEHDARFCFPEVRLGIVPATIMPYVIQRTATSNIAQWIYSAQPFSASQAQQCNLIDIVTDKNELEERLNNLITDIQKASPVALRVTKKLMRLFKPGISYFLKTYTYLVLANLKRSEHGQEGLRAFLEKRLPNWTRPKK